MLLLLTTCLLAAPEQDPREPLWISATGSTTSNMENYCAVLSRRDRTIAVWIENRHVLSSFGDGRGLSQHSPTRVDFQSFSRVYGYEPLIALEPEGRRAYLMFSDVNPDPLAGDQIPFFFHAPTATTWTFVNHHVDPFGPPSFYYSFGSDMAVEWGSSNSADKIYVAGVHMEYAGFGYYKPWFNRSLDGGSHWLATTSTLPIGASQRADYHTPQLLVQGSDVWLFWIDANYDNDPLVYVDLLVQHSSDGGVTWLPAPVQLNPPASSVRRFGSPSSFAVVQSGTNLMVLYATSAPSSEAVVVRSFDQGITWTPPATIGVTQPASYLHSGLALLHDQGRVVAAFVEHAQAGAGEMFVNTTSNWGSSWDGVVSLDTGLHSISADALQVTRLAQAADRLLLIQPNCEVRASRDQGSTWGAPQDLRSSSNTAQPSYLQSSTVNEWYGNLIAVWDQAPPGGGTLDHWMGGVRQQTLDLLGNVQASFPIVFEFSNFPAGTGHKAGVMLSGFSGVSKLPDDRRTGLSFSGLLYNQAKPSFHTIFSANLNVAGYGLSMPNILHPSLGGKTIYLVGFGFTNSPTSIGAITDLVVRTVAP